jgi:hypothetical protein
MGFAGLAALLAARVLGRTHEVPPGDGGPDAGPALPDEREPCADRDPLRRAFFGDLHIHTKLSFDAAAWGTRSTPEEAYRYARGEPLGLFPYDASGEGTRTIQLDRPLDFAAVTEHAEFLAEVTMCTDPSSPAYDSTTCVNYRAADSEGFNFGEFATTFLTNPPRRPGICSPYDEACEETRDRVWWRLQEAAEAYYDRTASCEFTTFVAYEWSATTGSTANIHRNVIFRNRSVPAVPTSFIEAPTPEELWDALDATCNDTGTPCDTLAIPHNSNVGGGLMFEPAARDGTPYDREEAERRSRLEPLMEIYQHKGASECLPGVPDPLGSEDPLCDFELLHRPICADDPSDPPDCTPLCTRLGGGGLIGGLRGGERLRPTRPPARARRMATGGRQPLRLWLHRQHGHAQRRGRARVGGRVDGAPGRSGRHRRKPPALPGRGLPRHQDQQPRGPGRAVGGGQLPGRALRRHAAPGGLRHERHAPAGALLRGERTCPRGCATRRTWWPRVTSGGCPWGASSERRRRARPRFVVWALRDPRSVPLERIQIIKGTMVNGELHEEVVDVVDAVDPEDGPATVDLTTCAPRPRGSGAEQLCGTWTDAGHDAIQPAFYYARVLENPTCRWSHRQCLEAGVDCAAMAEDDPLVACCDGSLPPTIRERAWTSPIWVVPGE